MDDSKSEREKERGGEKEREERESVPFGSQLYSGLSEREQWQIAPVSEIYLAEAAIAN